MLLPLLLACASIRPQFDAARAAALADPPPLRAAWEPDIELQLSSALVDELLDEAIAAQPALTTELTLGPAWAKPRLTVDEVVLRPSLGVDGLLLDVALDGHVRWGLGPADGRIPAEASATVVVGVDAVREGDHWLTTVKVNEVRSLDVDVAGESVGLGALDRRVRSWLDAALLEAPALPLTVVGGDGLPLRALRAEGAAKGLRLLAKSQTPVAVAVERPRGMPPEGFRLAVAEEALLALARAESFRHGAVGFDVVADPQQLSFTDGGFALGLRLWRPVGRGWWRDYDIDGTTKVLAKRVKLQATDVREGAKSKGAALADPLAALGEGVILRTLEDALDAAVPSTSEQALGGVEWVATVTDIAPGTQRTVVVSGTAAAR